MFPFIQWIRYMECNIMYVPPQSAAIVPGSSSSGGDDSSRHLENQVKQLVASKDDIEKKYRYSKKFTIWI